ncbi:MAG: hypothetical protein K8S99_04665 [Planctomycetes bacterium]|nr:hypothetical protein [Planctomycetota bacterium]
MLFPRRTIKLPPDLYEQAAQRAKELGLPSADAYVASLVEREVTAAKEKALRDQVLKQMKSLGYME